MVFIGTLEGSLFLAQEKKITQKTECGIHIFLFDQVVFFYRTIIPYSAVPRSLKA